MRTLVVVALTFLSAIAGTRAMADERSDRLAAAQSALIAWFECIECSNGELEAVLKFGNLVESALITTLQTGPSPAKRAEIEQTLREQHRSSPSQTISADRYVKLFSEDIDAGYRVRAAIALGRLRTPGALDALRTEANNGAQREDVREAARQALVR